MPFCPIWPASLKISAMVVATATAIPSMPKKLPRIEVVGWLSPLSAWMKQTLANKYKSVTRFKLISGPPSRESFCLSS